jgi:hypothetical protein
MEDYLMVIKTKINTKEDVYNLNLIASQQPYDMFVSYGCDVYDAKSLLALYDLIGKEVNIVAPDRVDPKEFAHVVKKMGLVNGVD